MESRKDFFNKIYAASLAKDKQTLEKYKFELNLLDSQGLLTPIGQLAKEGKKEAVIFLVQHGGNIDNAAMGAAIGHHHELAELLRARYGANIHLIAKGAAIGGDFEYLEKLIKKYQPAQEFIVEGTAMGGHIEALKKYSLNYTICLSQIAFGVAFSSLRSEAERFLPAEILTLKNKLAMGSMQAGDLQYARKCNAKGADIKYLIHAAVLAGNKEFIVEMREHENWNANEHFRNAVIEGFLSGVAEDIYKINWTSEIFDIRLSKDQANFFIKALIQADQQDFLIALLEEVQKKVGLIAKALLPDVTVLSMLESLTQLGEKGRFKLISYFLQKAPGYIYRRRKFDICHGFHLNHDFSNKELALHRLSFLSDQNILSLFAGDFLNIKDVICMARKIHSLMEKYHIDFDQAEAFLENIKLRRMFLYLPFNFADFPIEIGILMLMKYSSLSFSSTKDLYEKVSLNWNKEFLAADLDKYQSSFWVHHRERAKSFKSASEACQTRGDLVALVRYQRELFDGAKTIESQTEKHEKNIKNAARDEYFEIIEKHNNRL